MERLNFGWVLQGRLAGAQGPTQISDLEFFKQQGVEAIVRMERATISGEELGLTDLYEPVPDFSAPELHQIERMVAFIREQTENQRRPVVVTCFAGQGRTGTVLACYLVQSGYSPQAAISLVRGLRPGSIQVRQQEEAVHRFSAFYRRRSTEGDPGPTDGTEDRKKGR